jgi:hypothetical protein
MEKETADDGMNTDCFTAAGSPGDKQMGHFGQIADY